MSEFALNTGYLTELQLRAAAALRLRKQKEEELKHYSTQREYYRLNPLEWIHDRFGIKKETIKWSLNPGYENHKWDGTPDPLFLIMDAIANRTARTIGVESGTGTGKTFDAALIALWFWENFEDALVVTTAPKKDQLTLHIWKEIGKLQPMMNQGELTTLKLRMIPGKDNWIVVGFVAGVAADEDSTTKAQGFHAKYMLIIFEETPGIPRPTITAFQNTAVAENNFIIALGNPDNQFDNLHTFCKDADLHIRISALDHPNIVLNNPNFIPGAQSTYGLKKFLKMYGGKDHPMYMSRARGISPKQAFDSLIKMEWITECLDMAKDEDLVRILKNGPKAMGVDVANSEAGDKAAICKGQGAVCLSIKDFQCPDANQLGKRDVAQIMREENIESHHVGIDGVGVGAGTVNALKEMDFDVINIQSGASPIEIEEDENKYNNLRTQMWWQCREDLKNKRIIPPNDPELHADLCTPKWETKDKYIVMESKEKIKDRLGRSPNKGDAFVYWNWVRINREGSNIEFLKW